MSSVPVNKRNHVVGFVALKHAAQVRKYTGEPYRIHLMNVARMVDGKCNFGFEIGMCHDLLEDTDTTEKELYDALLRFGYEPSEASFITKGVVDLTDVYTSEACPDMNRKLRKDLEAHRLWEISPGSQTVKYGDLIDNTTSIVEHDKDFAKKYLAEKAEILKGMNKGDKELYEKALKNIAVK